MVDEARHSNEDIKSNKNQKPSGQEFCRQRRVEQEREGNRKKIHRETGSLCTQTEVPTAMFEMAALMAKPSPVAAQYWQIKTPTKVKKFDACESTKKEGSSFFPFRVCGGQSEHGSANARLQSCLGFQSMLLVS